MRCSARDRIAYRSDGYVLLEHRLERTVLEALDRAVTQWVEESGTAGPFGILKNNLWCEHEDVARFVHDGEMAQLACELLEVSEIALFQDNLVCKPAGAQRIEWHQDYSYWPLDRPSGTTLWIALDDADRENGCLHYVPGTQRSGERQPADFIRGASQPLHPHLPPLDWTDHEHEAVPAAAAAGQMVAHHPLVWHMSGVNGSERSRRAFTMTWITPDVCWDPGHAPHPYNYALGPAAGAPVRGELFPRFQRHRTPGAAEGPEQG